MSESEFIRPKTKDLEIKVPFVSENDQLEPPPLVNYFGKRSKTVCVCVCVCVCQALSRRVFCNQVVPQGGKASSDEPCPTKLSRWRGSTERRLGVYLLSSSQAVTLLLHGLFHGSSCFHPQTSVLQLSCAVRSPPLSTAVKRNSLCSNTYSFLDLSPYRSTAILLIVEIELTENQCRSVSRSAVPHGCWV